MPVGLADDADAEPLGFEQPPDQRHAEARMIDVGVAGDDDDVAGVPAQRAHFLARHRQERGDAEALCPVLAIGIDGLIGYFHAARIGLLQFAWRRAAHGVDLLFA